MIRCVTLILFTLIAIELPPKAWAQKSPSSETGGSRPTGTKGRLGSLQFRATDDLVFGALTPDGKTLAVCSSRSVIHWFDTETGKKLHEASWGYDNFLESSYRRPPAPFMFYAPDNRRLFLFRNQNEINWCEFDHRKPQEKTVQHVLKDLRNPIAVTSDCRFAAFIDVRTGPKENPGSQRSLSVVDLTTGKMKWQQQMEKLDGLQASLSPDGNSLALWQKERKLGLKDGEENPYRRIRIWDLSSGKEKHVLDADDDDIAHVRFSPDGSLLVSQHKSQFQVWETATGKMRRRFTGHAHDEWMEMRFSPDGKQFAIGGQQGDVQIWDVVTGKRLTNKRGPIDCLHLLHYCTDGRLLACAFDGSSVHIWDAMTGKSLLPDQPGHSGAIESLRFSDSSESLSSVAADGRVIDWILATGKIAKSQTFEWMADQNADHRVRRNIHGGSKFAPDGKYLYCMEFAHNRHGIFDLKNRDFVLDLDPPDGGFNFGTIAFSPDSRRFTTMRWSDGRDRDKIVVPVWDIDSNEMTHRFVLGKGGISAPAFSTDGRLLALALVTGNARDDSAKTLIWIADLSADKKLVEVQAPNNSVESLLFLDHRQLLVVADGKPALTLLDGYTGRELRTFSGNPGPLLFDGVVLSRDRRLLAISSLSDKDRESIDGRPRYVWWRERRKGASPIRVWEIASGEVRHEFTGDDAEITCLAFAPDGKSLASGSADSTILVWDLRGSPGRITPIRPDDLDLHWKKMAEIDAVAAEMAMRRLSEQPDMALPFLSMVLKPLERPQVTVETINRLIRTLESDSFPERETARKELERIGDGSLPAIEKALNAKPGNDLMERLEKLRSFIQRPDTGEKDLRLIRAIELVERIGTPQARTLLRKMAEGDAHAKVTQDAKAALDRLSGGK